MNIKRVRERLKKHEAVIPWMYLDTTGHVTVACGRCLETAAEAKTPPFLDRVTRAPATPEAIDRIPDADSDWFWNELCRLLPEVRAYPDHIQEALLDLTYNLGPAGLMARKNLIAAARKGDWEAAATLAHRREVSEERNEEIAGLLLGLETIE